MGNVMLGKPVSVNGSIIKKSGEQKGRYSTDAW